MFGVFHILSGSFYFIFLANFWPLMKSVSIELLLSTIFIFKICWLNKWYADKFTVDYLTLKIYLKESWTWTH